MRKIYLLAIWLAPASFVCPAQITFTEYPVPTSGSLPDQITTGPDGNLWFGELVTGIIGRITPAGVITEFSTPTVDSRPQGITAGPDGNVWFAEGSGGNSGCFQYHGLCGNIGRITPAGVITEFTIPSGGRSGPGGITTRSDGNLWFTTGDSGGGYIWRMTTTGSFTMFPVPAGGPQELITAGPDGNLWFTDYFGAKIGRATTAGVNYGVFGYHRVTLGSWRSPQGQTAMYGSRIIRQALSGESLLQE